eukprot:CAMPEP_0171305752 /NCGR_PEP_ID=MMETSP0816-20121228/15593_1 /TAXON_ID=420281 /ORGANISM="Proboscia inermis, Strain CCAP1064/1" /LENGTH=70 /DNA_ID=CAMNT_0011786785 /DNA_START=59 /DNA_END=271 /DNA_ORIENTATION=+
MPDKYAETDWKDLPDEVRKAAELMEYTEEMWDAEPSVESDMEEYDWDELSPEQQGAATTLGYTKEEWDNE